MMQSTNDATRMPDTETSDNSVSEPKKGRGRPRLPNALTPAQRAKRYRDRKRARQSVPAASAGTGNDSGHASSAQQIEELRAENARLAQALAGVRQRNRDLTGALELFVDARANNRKISAELMKGLHKLLAFDEVPPPSSRVKKNSR